MLKRDPQFIHQPHQFLDSWRFRVRIARLQHVSYFPKADMEMMPYAEMSDSRTLSTE
ncbi:unnamed protein product [Trifolium pratense]|uniref:Uncharacterized protein n=1 Tax=Trifolium pratense TaxID=57577 RepID=A0ACB0I9F3_TRIPR|nr:unnamed protein product [Trifolium pratense]